MRNILIICNNYSTGKDANGVCAKNVVEQLRREGHNVYIITEYDKSIERDEFVNFIKEEKQRNGFIEKIIKAYNYPNTMKERAKKYIIMARKIIQIKNIDIVISFYKPFDTIFAAYTLKKEFSNVFFVNYHMDILTDPDEPNCFLKLYKCIKAKMFFKREYRLIDLVLLPMSLSGVYKEINIEYVDFPLYIKYYSDEKYNTDFFNHNVINIVYIGTLDYFNRNPHFFFELLKEYNNYNRKKIELHIWGNIDQKVSQMIDGINVIYHGYIQNKFVRSIQLQADFILNVSNKITYNWIPSKIFDLFSIGKPIINILFNEKDVSIEYFKKYKFYFDITPKYCISCDEMKNFKEFILQNLGRKSEINDLLFEKAMPEYLTAIIWKHEAKFHDKNTYDK